MADRKWNNQGGSNFDAFSGKYKKPKEQPNIPKFSDLDESNSTSFNYKVPPKPKPKLGNFGNEIWTYSPVDDSPAPYVPFVDLTPKDPRIPTIKEKTPIPSIPKTDPVTSSTDLFPFTVFNEYEIVVKFGLLVLRISSGQAYAARQGLNDPRYDFSLVIKSSNAISFGGNNASTINLISVSNSAQNPIYSLYNWLKTKLSIATNNDATGADSVLSSIDIVENVAQLPITQFVSNGFTCGLFYAEGIQPDQICLNATNKVFKFEPSVNNNPTWTVTYPGKILPLCLDINSLQIVSIKLIPATLNAINRGSGGKFVIRIARDATIAQLASSLKVDVKITSPELILFQQELDPSLYATTGFTDVTLGSISVTIPALEYFTDVTIEPLSDPTKLVNVPLKVEIIGSWVPDSTPDYSINALFLEVDATVKPRLLVASINFAPNSPASLVPGLGSFVVRVSIDTRQSIDTSIVTVIGGTAAGSEYTISGVPVTILAGSSYADITITPLLPQPATSKSITVTIIPSSDIVVGTPVTVTATISDVPFELIIIPYNTIKTLPNALLLSHGFDIRFNQPYGIPITVRVTVTPESSDPAVNDLVSVAFPPFNSAILFTRSFIITLPAPSTIFGISFRQLSQNSIKPSRFGISADVVSSITVINPAPLTGYGYGDLIN